MVDDDTGVIGYVNDPGLVITAGNYTVYTLATYLKTEIPKIDGDSNWNTYFKNKFTLKIDYSTDDGKFTYTLTPDDASKNWSLYFDFTSSDKQEQDKYANVETGFPLGSNRIQYQASADPPLTSTCLNVVDISGSIHGVYVRTNLVSNGTLDSQTGTFSNILSRLPINVASGGIIFANPSNNVSRSLVDIRSINSLTIRLTDERNRLVDLNGLHFQVSILLEFVFAERNPISIGRSPNHSYKSFKSSNMKTQIQQYQQRLQDEKEQSNRRGPGRPRRVGRPRSVIRPVGRPKGT